MYDHCSSVILANEEEKTWKKPLAEQQWQKTMVWMFWDEALKLYKDIVVIVAQTPNIYMFL